VLYIQEGSYQRQVAALRILAGRDNGLLCLWLFPESQENTIAGYEVVPAQGLEPITTYGNGTIPVRTQLVPVSEEVFSALLAHEAEVKEKCDSITLYFGSEPSWYAATVGHEGMCIAREQDHLSRLKEKGFNVSTKAPEWW
jgi:hypothetical protein